MGHHPTPILDIRGAARLWACLPGARASAFRSTLADTWIRVFGGDETLVDDIRRNRQIQDNLPRDHPGRAFGEAVDERTQTPPSPLTIPDVQNIITRAVETALEPLHDRIRREITAREDSENRFIRILEDVRNGTRQEIEARLTAERAAREIEIADLRARNALLVGELERSNTRMVRNVK